MSATSIDLSQIKTDALSAASTFRTLIGLGTSDTPTFKSATLSAGTLNGTVLDIAQTWGGTGTYTGIKYNVTDSGPANAASLLLDLQVGGVSKLNVAKSGNLTVNAPKITLNGSISLENNAGAFEVYRNAGQIFYADSSNCYVGGAFRIGFNNGLVFEQDAAGIFAQRNGANAQSLRIYKTYSGGGTNFERGVLDWQTTSDVLRIGTEAGGTGTVRNIALVGGKVGIGTTTFDGALTVLSTLGAISANGNGVSSQVDWTPTSNESTFSARGGLYTVSKYGSANVTSAIGLRGLQNQVVNFGSGNVTSAAGFLAIVQNVGSGTISTGYAAYIYSPNSSVSNPITNAFGVFVESQKVTGVTNGYGIYCNGSNDINYFAGSVGIGAIPAAKLDISDTTGAGSGSLQASALNIAQTWNTTGTPTAFKLNVTDTASNAASLLMDLQVGGVSKFKVAKDGGLSDSSGYFKTYGGLCWNAQSVLNANIAVGSGGYIGFGNAVNDIFNVGTHDIKLIRDAANTLALRRANTAGPTTYPQAFRIYNNVDGTDAAPGSNWERAKIAWSSNVLQIGTEKLGTGAARALELQTDGTTRLTISTTGVATIPNTLDLTIRTVTYGATMAIDAALGNKIAITLAGNGTISNPTNAVDGRVLVFRLRQDGSGNRVPVWDTKFAFVGDLATVTLSTAANKIDRVAFEYDSTDDKWYCISFIKGS